VGQQLVEVDFRAKGLAAQGLVGVGKTRLGKAHEGGQFAEHLGVGLGLTHRRDCRLVQQHIGVAVAGVNVPVLKLGGGRQDVVGIVGGVGLEVLQHHGEQVGPCKTLHHFG